MTKIGFAGMGMMGFGMANNLLKAGFEVYIWNRTKEKAQAVIGANIVDKPKDLCEKAEIIFTCLSNDAALNEVLFSEEGIFKTLGEGQTFVDSGTTSIDFTQRMAEHCDNVGANFIDAPVTGGKSKAESGELLYMIGAKKEVLDKYRDIFNAMAGLIVHCGDVTYGQRAKIALNITQSMIFQSYMEGIAIATKNGVSQEVIREVFDNAGPRNNVSLGKFPRVENRDFEADFYMHLMNKDVNLAKQEIEKNGLKLPLAQAIISVFDDAMKSNLGDEDWISIAKLIEEKNSISFKK